MHIPFVGMVKFKFLAHFPVDHLAHPVVSSLVLLLCQFAALVLMPLFCAAIRGDSVSLLRFPFLTMPRFCRVRCCLLVV